MEKGDVFTYRKKEYKLLAVCKTVIDGEDKLEYMAKEIDKDILHRFMYNDKGKLYKII